MISLGSTYCLSCSVFRFEFFGDGCCRLSSEDFIDKKTGNTCKYVNKDKQPAGEGVLIVGYMSTLFVIQSGSDE